MIPTYYKKKLPITLFFLLIFLGVLSTNTTLGEMLSVKGDGVNLRTGPGKEYAIRWQYGSGFPVEILEQKGNWLKVRDFEDDTGWLHTSILSKNQQTIVKVNKNKDQKVNIRQAPGSNSKIVGKAYYGVVFKIIGRQSGWIQVQHESGLTGWISSNLLWGI